MSANSTEGVAEPQWPGVTRPSEAGGGGPPRKIAPWNLVVGGVLVLLLATVLLWPHEGPAPHPDSTMTVDTTGVTLTPDAPQWQYVELAVAQEGALLLPVPAPGRVDFDEKRTANVGTPLAGKVDAVVVRVGDVVKTGEKLFSVRSGSFADLNREMQAAREEVMVKTRLRDRARELVALKIAPEKEALAAEAELREVELTLKAATAKESSLGVQEVSENLFWVRAPRAGTIVDLDLFASQQVNPERDKPLLRISDIDEVLVFADFQESDAADLKPGQPVVIRTQTGVEREGSIDRVSSLVDPVRRTVEVRVRAQNPDRLFRPNSFVEVVPQPDPTVRRVKVPSEAVVSEGSQAMVFVAKSGGRLERIKVTPGRQRDGEVELRAGLEPGTRYVAKGAILLLNQVDLSSK